VFPADITSPPHARIGARGTARIKLRNGKIRLAEIHWYEAHGIGKKELKRKRYLD